jgi:DNA-binding protein H-NS
LTLYYNWHKYKITTGATLMPTSNFINILKDISLADALKLRIQLDDRLQEMRAELDQYWGKVFPNGPGNSRGSSSLKGTKVAPKYRGPNGETWAGRGAKPRWLVAAMKKGKKLDSFLISKSA